MAKLLGYGDVTSKQVYERAVAGDERAREVFAVMGEALGVALATLVNAFQRRALPAQRRNDRRLGVFSRPRCSPRPADDPFSFRTTNTRVEKAKLGGEAGSFRRAAYLPWSK